MHKSIISCRNMIDSGLILMPEFITHNPIHHSLNLLRTVHASHHRGIIGHYNISFSIIQIHGIKSIFY